MVDFHKMLQQKVQEIRDRLGEADIGNFRLDIEISGQTLTGDVKIEFTIGSCYDGKNARGGNIDNLIKEYIRRLAWASKNASICLPKVESPPDDEIPF